MVQAPPAETPHVANDCKRLGLARHASELMSRCKASCKQFYFKAQVLRQANPAGQGPDVQNGVELCPSKVISNDSLPCFMLNRDWDYIHSKEPLACLCLPGSGTCS